MPNLFQKELCPFRVGLVILLPLFKDIPLKSLENSKYHKDKLQMYTKGVLLKAQPYQIGIVFTYIKALLYLLTNIIQGRISSIPITSEYRYLLMLILYHISHNITRDRVVKKSISVF